MSKKSLLLIVLVTFLAFCFRIYNLTSSPEGLYIDETSIAYNAYSLVETGRDEHGRFLPLFFEAFGEWKLPVYVYAVAAAQFLLGPIDAAVRIPAVLFGTFTIPLLFLLVKELFTSVSTGEAKQSSQTGLLRLYVPRNDILTAFMAAFLLAISPWHFQFTHAGFEASAGVFFIVTGLYLFFVARRKKSLWLLLLGFSAFVLSLYSYNSARIVVPVLVLVLILCNIRKFTLLQWLITGTLALVVSIPFLKFSLSPAGLVRAQQVSIFYQLPKEKQAEAFGRNLWKNISPEYLFVKGDPTIAHMTPYRMSLLYLIEAPFVFVGLLFTLKKIKTLYPMLLLLIVGFIPPAITTLNPHALRAVLVVPAIVFISAFGFVSVVFRIKNVLVRSGFIMLYSILLLTFAAGFLRMYHNFYTPNAGWDWQVDFKRTAEVILEKESAYERVLTGPVGPSRIAFLWYLKIPPQQFLETKNKNQLGKYHFNLESFESVEQTGRNLVVSKKAVPGGLLLGEVQYPNGTTAYTLWEL